MPKSLVTVTFELYGNIDPQRFIEWLKVETTVAEDGDGSFNSVEGDINYRKCDIVTPVTIQTWNLGV